MPSVARRVTMPRADVIRDVDASGVSMRTMLGTLTRWRVIRLRHDARKTITRKVRLRSANRLNASALGLTLRFYLLA